VGDGLTTTLTLASCSYAKSHSFRTREWLQAGDSSDCTWDLRCEPLNTHLSEGWTHATTNAQVKPDDIPSLSDLPLSLEDIQKGAADLKGVLGSVGETGVLNGIMAALDHLGNVSLV